MRQAGHVSRAGWLRLLIALYCGWATRAVALEALALPAQYYFDTFGTEFGLPQTNVTAALQTRDGYLWVGTEAGLGRFDGVRFVAFKRANTPAFANHSIRRLFEDREGTLWIATESGVVRRRNGVFEQVGLSGTIVTSIAQDGTDRMWFGTEGRGVHSLRDGQFKSYESDPAMIAASVRGMFVDSADRLWVGFVRTPGVVYFENERFHFRDIGGEHSRETFAIAEWPRGTLWFGCGRGIHRMTGDKVVRVDRMGDLPNPQVTDLRMARDGGLWVVAGGVLKITAPDPLTFTLIPRLPAQTSRSVVEDREGSLWICAQSEGLIRARRMYYRTVTIEDGLPGNVIKTVSQDSAGNSWLAIQSHGLTRVTPNGAITVWSRNEGMLSHDPLAAYAASDGTVWIAYSLGLVAWRDGDMEVFPQYPSARVMHEDRRGNMWFGTDQQLLRWVPGQPIAAIPIAGGKNVVINAIAEDSAGYVYVASSPAGLSRIDARGEITTYDERIGFPSNGGVRSLYVDGDARIWVGMKGRGLGVLLDGRWYNPDSLADGVMDHVSAIAEDRRGQLWLGTPSGIMFAAKSELLSAARGEQPAVRMRLAGLGDGFRVTPASSHSLPTVWSTRNNTLLFATRRGLLEINPDHTPPNGMAPPVHIEQVVVDGRPLARTDRIEVAPGVRQLVIEYTALSFVEPRRVSFRYRLEGHDSDWVDAGSRRVASYAHLPSGDYVFRVVACNSDGQWNELGDRIAIRQLPYFYETWWFGALTFVAIGMIGFGAFRWSHRRLELRLERMEEKQALERERHRIAKNLHDDLGANLTEIGLFAEVARRRTTLPEAMEDMQELSNRVRGLVGSLDAIVWAANPANDSLDQVATYICEYFQSLFARSSIRCRVDVAGDMPALMLTPEERTNLFLTAKEAMNNVLKHSGAAQAWLRVKMEGDCFCLSIEDDGRGFDPQAPENARRNGLQNMRSRIEELSGTFLIDAAPGRRTRVIISISFAGKRRLDVPGEPDQHKNGSPQSKPNP